MLKYAVAVGALLVGSVASAQTPSPFGLVLEGGFEFGGDPIGYVLFSDGSTQEIEAGNGLYFAGGVRITPPSIPDLDIVAVLGKKITYTAASNSNANFDRNVFKVEGRYHVNPDVWLSGGIVNHQSVEFDCDNLCKQKYEFDASTGITVGAGWQWFGITYTNIEYSDDQHNIYDASNFGILLTARF
jgi:hypothetical protein